MNTVQHLALGRLPSPHSVVVTTIFRVSKAALVVDVAVELNDVSHVDKVTHQAVLLHVTRLHNQLVDEQDRLLLLPVVLEANDGFARINYLLYHSSDGENISPRIIILCGHCEL